MKAAKPVEHRLNHFGPITEILDSWHTGDQDAIGEVMPLVYDLLRDQAGYYLGMEEACFTLQPTGLVNEAYLRLAASRHVRFENRTHFYFFISRLMRRVLVEHARAKNAKRRGEGSEPARLDEFDTIAHGAGLAPEWVLSLEDALARLDRLDPQRARIVTLRFFGGLKMEEIGEVLEISLRTVKRNWRTARLWLAKEIGNPADGFFREQPIPAPRRKK